MTKKWFVIYLGPEDSYGIAQQRVSFLELACRGMAMERAQEICELLNAGGKLPPTRPRA
jgi:hypothetical protein